VTSFLQERIRSSFAQEIAVIEELLAEQPDSKCECLIQVQFNRTKQIPGCMESLVHYNRLLLKDYCSNSDGLEQKCLDFLQKLEKIDSPRKSRYQEICERSLYLHAVEVIPMTDSSTDRRPSKSTSKCSSHNQLERTVFWSETSLKKVLAMCMTKLTGVTGHWLHQGAV
jgi:hypothetical protein